MEKDTKEKRRMQGRIKRGEDAEELVGGSSLMSERRVPSTWFPRITFSRSYISDVMKIGKEIE